VEPNSFLKYHFQVFEDDELPKSICPICLKYLNDIYDFKDLIVKSDLHLRSQQVKTVDSDEDSENMNDLYNADTSLDEDNLKYHQPIVQIKCEGRPGYFISCQEENKDLDIHLQKQNEYFEELQVNLINDNNSNEKETKRKSKTYKCDQCQNSFKNRYNLILHKTTHTGEFPHSCDICNKGFATNWAMNVHRRIHFEERPFKCENCDKSFK
jgi:hypothetical protein